MISRRSFIRGAVSGAMAFPLAATSRIFAAPTAEVLYNGITLGSPWPPRLKFPDDHPVRPAYLADPPAIIPIDVGRQLLVDDFLIEETTLWRTCHKATFHPANPILRPETAWELRDPVAERTKMPSNPAATVFSDGVFYDPSERLFKMWYMAGYSAFTAMATSVDGITWTRPTFDVVPGTNIVSQAIRDSTTIWLDQFETDRRRRYKMSMWNDHYVLLYTSPDGIHWTEIGKTGRTDDRSTFFYNPFRRVWAFSLRANQFASSISGRYRKYWESPEFATAPNWNLHDPVAWVKADSHDFARKGVADLPELYNLDCVAYESVMLGLFSIWRGESPLREKINELTVGFSRDGFHWHRPDRETFIPVSEKEGSWNWGNVQSAGGCCVIAGDQLYFYVSGRQGRPGTDAPGMCSTGLATLRRDGFASMDWTPENALARKAGDHGSLTTRPITFGGGHLFVNADLSGGGELRVEVLDRRGNLIAPFTQAACAPVRGDGARMAVQWTGASLASLAGQAVRFRFSLTRGRLFAFWVSAWPTGESGGYPAAGGPAFRGPLDTRAR